MAFIPVPNTVRVSIEFVWAGQIVAITLAFTRPDAPTSGNMQALAAALDTWRINNYRTVQGNGISATRMLLVDQTSQNGPSVEFPITTSQAGNVAGISAPNNASIVTTFLTALRGRAYRGRSYFPGMAQSQLSGSTGVTSALQTALNNIFLALNPAITTGQWTHTVISRQLNGAPRIIGVATPVISYRTEQFIDSQRRRLAGRGM